MFGFRSHLISLDYFVEASCIWSKMCTLWEGFYEPHYFPGLTALTGASSQEVLGSYQLFWWIATHCVDIICVFLSLIAACFPVLSWEYINLLSPWCIPHSLLIFGGHLPRNFESECQFCFIGVFPRSPKSTYSSVHKENPLTDRCHGKTGGWRWTSLAPLWVECHLLVKNMYL